MKKSACIVLGHPRDLDYPEIVNRYHIIFAEPCAHNHLKSISTTKNQLRLLICSEATSKNFLNLETSFHILSSFVDYSTRLIVTSRQIKPSQIFKLLAIPHLRCLTYELECTNAEEVRNFVLDLVKYSKRNNFKLNLLDSKCAEVRGTFSLSDLISKNKFVIMNLNKS